MTRKSSLSTGKKSGCYVVPQNKRKKKILIGTLIVINVDSIFIENQGGTVLAIQKRTNTISNTNRTAHDISKTCEELFPVVLKLKMVAKHLFLLQLFQLITQD